MLAEIEALPLTQQSFCFHCASNTKMKVRVPGCAAGHLLPSIDELDHFSKPL